MLYKVPFYIGNFIACMVPGRERRRSVRAYINMVLFLPAIWFFIRRAYGEHIHSIKYIRQISLGRVVFLVNDKYYVKVFRDVTNARLKDQEFLLNYTQKALGKNGWIIIPIKVAKRAPICACERAPGRHLTTYPPHAVLANTKHIEKQVRDIIKALQSVDVNKIPNKERFITAMQHRSRERGKPTRKKVLAHFDMNSTNFLFDDDMNICSVIDWDTLSIAQSTDSEWLNFQRHWANFLNRTRAALENNGDK